MDSLFTTTYSEDHQRLFEQAIREENVERAYEVLISLPPSKSEKEELSRMVVLVEGMNALIHLYKKIVPSIIIDYASLGTLEQIRVRDAKLKKYETLGRFDEIKEKLASLTHFTNGGKPKIKTLF